MSRLTLRQLGSLAAAGCLTVTGLATLGAAAAQAVSTTIVISEVYGGGGNSGATYTHDFVELFNKSTSTVDLTGYKVQYYSAAGTTATTTTLSGSIAPGGRFLVQQAKGAGGTTALPTPDATGTTAMSATGARVQLVAPDGSVVDLLGWGNATTFEGVAAGATSNTTSVARANPCVDTDSNAADFVVGAPTPQNSTAAATTCTAGPVDPEPVDPAETIAQIQGAHHLSPLVGQKVNDVEGIVVAKTSSGFWMQSLTPDDDIRTSEGIYVYGSRSAGVVAVGDIVTVDGSVVEFRPGGSGGWDNLTITEISYPTVTVESRGNALPAPVMIGIDRIAPQQVIENDNHGSVEYTSAALDFDPAEDAIDFYESLEGMYVGVRDAEVVGPTKSFGEFTVMPPNSQAVRSFNDGVIYGGYDMPNAMRIQVDDVINDDEPMVNTGDTLPGDMHGVIDYSFSNFKLLAINYPAVAARPTVREVTTAQTNNELAVATFNVENLAPTNPQEKFDRLAGQIVNNLRSPDILALEEIQDNNGAQNDAVVDSTTTVNKLIDAIVAAGGPRYSATWINPADDQDGGQPGGNIRVAFLYRADRDVELAPGTPGDATTAVDVIGSGKKTTLSLNPGRIDPNNPAWGATRKPLVAQFLFRGQSVFVVANHFSSKGGDDPLFGRWQYPVRSSEAKRWEQAKVIRTFADELLTADPNARLVVVGDVNDFQFSTTADTLVWDTVEGWGAMELLDLPRTLPLSEQYTYVYEGNSQVLDHILISKSLSTVQPGSKYAPYTYDIVHTNADFWDQDSDHDPQVVRLALRGGTGGKR